jgi:hypothetical protein
MRRGLNSLLSCDNLHLIPPMDFVCLLAAWDGIYLYAFFSVSLPHFLHHFHTPALVMTSSNSRRVTPRPTPAPRLASRIMSRSRSSETSCLSVMATRRRCAIVKVSVAPSPPPPDDDDDPVNKPNASATSAAWASSPSLESSRWCSLSAQMATKGSHCACPSSSGSRISRNSLSSAFVGGIFRALQVFPHLSQLLSKKNKST